jgi:ribosome-associated protein
MATRKEVVVGMLTRKQFDIKMIECEILKLLDDKKTECIERIDLTHDEARLTDTCIIGSGMSSRHLESVASFVHGYLKMKRLLPRVEGSGQSGWVLIESIGIEVHLFKPEVRRYYDIESLLR